MTNTNESRRQVAIERFLDAAQQILTEHGFARLRLADVVARSGMAQGSLFRYFPTKEHLVQAAFERALAAHIERLTAGFNKVGSDDSGIRGLFEAIWEAFSHPDFQWTYGLYSAAGTDPVLSEHIRAALATHKERVRDLNHALLGDGRLLDLRATERVVRFLTWTMQGRALQTMAIGDDGYNQEFIDFLVLLSGRVNPILDDHLTGVGLFADCPAAPAVT